MTSDRARTDDRADIEAVLAGDRVAWRRLYVRYGDAVYTTARRITGNDSEAGDIVQEVFLRLPEALRSYRGEGAIGNWLKRVAVNRAISMVRRRKRKREVAGDDFPQLVRGNPSGELIDRVWLERALDTLPSDLRIVLSLKSIEGYTHREIGMLLGIAEATSMDRLYRAKRLLREWLGEDVAS